jgi:hypothetical protein
MRTRPGSVSVSRSCSLCRIVPMPAYYKQDLVFQPCSLCPTGDIISALMFGAGDGRSWRFLAMAM